MKTNKFTTRVLAEVAILTAIAFALDALQGGLFRGLWPNGGSFGIAMVPILILCYRRGFLAGLLGGIGVSVIQCLGGVYAIADTWWKVMLQVLLDYILTYPMVALAGLFFKNFQAAETNKQKALWISVGTVVGGLGKLLCHFIAGFIFWSSSTPEGFPGGAWFYSLVYNGSYMIPNIIICAIIVSIIAIKQPKLLNPNYDNMEVAHEN